MPQTRISWIPSGWRSKFPLPDIQLDYCIIESAPATLIGPPKMKQAAASYRRGCDRMFSDLHWNIPSGSHAILVMRVRSRKLEAPTARTEFPGAASFSHLDFSLIIEHPLHKEHFKVAFYCRPVSRSCAFDARYCSFMQKVLKRATKINCLSDPNARRAASIHR